MIPNYTPPQVRVYTLYMSNLSQILRIQGPPRGFINMSANWLTEETY